ncbi:MAG: ATP-binding cassette domain-containing protein [Clostridia bacterium]|nr:ATP-binding cassette domain-containing protein [Clostridia bacterium]
MLKLENIAFAANTERGRKDILKNIDLEIGEGFTVVTGPNGGGKSSLAKVIAGLYKPTAGRIFWNGEDVTDMSITERAKAGISYAFQQPVRFKGITVSDLITIAAGRDLSVSEACEYLSAVGLCARDYIDREVNASLSGGELKRIEIATVLARGTDFAVFDEPEAGIDLWSFNSLIKVFERLRTLTKGSIMIISHQERILEIADRIVVISGGTVEKAGPRDEILPELMYDRACPRLDKVNS